MTDKHADIRESLALITEGKWFTYRDESTYVGALENDKDTHIAECFEWEDAQFIAASPEYVRRLLDDYGELSENHHALELLWLQYKQENERLRNALELIIKNTVSGHVENIAKRALEGRNELVGSYVNVLVYGS